jgi:hypothetical protein
MGVSEYMKVSKETKGATPESFINNLLAIQNKAQLAHWKSLSFSQHSALSDFYEGVQGLIDDFIETYQGKYELLNLSFPESKREEPIAFLQNACRTISMERKIFTDSYLQNQIDEIETLLYKTLYKLRFLK